MGDPEQQPQPTTTAYPTQTTQQSSGAITVNVSYVKSPRGILKIVEIVFLLLAFACAADWCGMGCRHGRYSFFLFATVMPWILCIVIFIMYLFCLVDKIPQVNWTLTILINSIVWAVVLLIAASLWANFIDGLSKYNVRMGGGIASVVFAFLAIIAFIVDIFVHIKVSRG